MSHLPHLDNVTTSKFWVNTCHQIVTIDYIMYVNWELWLFFVCIYLYSFFSFISLHPSSQVWHALDIFVTWLLCFCSIIVPYLWHHNDVTDDTILDYYDVMLSKQCRNSIYKPVFCTENKILLFHPISQTT